MALASPRLWAGILIDIRHSPGEGISSKIVDLYVSRAKADLNIRLRFPLSNTRADPHYVSRRLSPELRFCICKHRNLISSYLLYEYAGQCYGELVGTLENLTSLRLLSERLPSDG